MCVNCRPFPTSTYMVDMNRLLLLSLFGLAACSLENSPVAVAPESGSVLSENPQAQAAPSLPTNQLTQPVDHFWEAQFEGSRGDVPRMSNLDDAMDYNKLPKAFCSRTVSPNGERIVALNFSYTDLQEVGETCVRRIVSGDSDKWLELAPAESKEWTRATTKLPDVGTLVGLVGHTTVTARHDVSESGSTLTLQGWTPEAELRWTRSITADPSWPVWTPTGLLVIHTQDARGFLGVTVMDPRTGDVVGTQRLDERLQRVVNDPWALVERSRTARWKSDQWPPNTKGDLVSNGLRVQYSNHSYLEYSVYDVETGNRVWQKAINPGRHTRTLFVEVEGPWLLVSIVLGEMTASDLMRSPSPREALRQQDDIMVLAYELATGKAVGAWSYALNDH